MSKRVLITGINGFAGGYLWPAMAAQGFEVVGIANGRSDTNLTGKAEVYVADLRDLDTIRAAVTAARPTHVVHLAAISVVDHGNVGEIYDVNVVGTFNLLTALSELREKPESILLISSGNVYGDSGKGILSETDEVNPMNNYAVSKLAMEYVARQFLGVLNLVIARPFNYTGRGQLPYFLIPKIVNHFRDRAAYIELGNVDVARDFSDVRMVVQYFSRLLQLSTASGDVFNICTGKFHRLDHVIDICEEITGHHIEVRVNPDFVRRNEIETQRGDARKLHQAVGLVKSYPLRKTLEWMLK